MERLEREGVIYLPAIRVFVVSAESGPVALSAMSPGGGRLLYCRPSASFLAPGGETFGRSGSLIAGSAPRNMDRVGVRVRQELVEVNPEIVIRGLPRSDELLIPLEAACRVPGPEDPPGFAAEPVGPAQ